MARQRLGQHFLGDAGVRDRIARAIRIPPHEAPITENGVPYCWIEVGAGHGEMTQHLVQTGVPVHAIELDPPLIARLEGMRAEHRNLTVTGGDVLKADLRRVAEGLRMRIYGNLPYYITSPILHHFFEFAELIDEIHIVIQQEVAFRIVARPGTRDYGYLSVLCQYFSQPRIGLKIPRGAFRPPPKVGSALVSMTLPGERATLRLADDEKFLDFVKLAFSQKRKTLVNNLRSIAEPAQVKALLAKNGFREDARAEQLAVASLAQIFLQVRQPS